jgi:hypothetical protein
VKYPTPNTTPTPVQDPSTPLGPPADSQRDTPFNREDLLGPEKRAEDKKKGLPSFMYAVVGTVAAGLATSVIAVWLFCCRKPGLQVEPPKTMPLPTAAINPYQLCHQVPSQNFGSLTGQGVKIWAPNESHHLEPKSSGQAAQPLVRIAYFTSESWLWEAFTLLNFDATKRTAS